MISLPAYHTSSAEKKSNTTRHEFRIKNIIKLIIAKMIIYYYYEYLRKMCVLYKFVMFGNKR